MPQLIKRQNQKRLDKLLHVEDPIFDTVWERAALDFTETPLATKLIKGVTKHIKFYVFSDEDKLIRRRYNDDCGKPPEESGLHTFNTAALAVCAAGTGDTETANDLVECIERKIGFGQLRHGPMPNFSYKPKNKMFFLDNCAMLSIAYSLIDRKDDARELVRSFEKSIGLNYKSDNGMLFNPCTKKILNPCPGENAIAALAYIGINESNTAFKILKGIESNFKFSDDGIVLSHDGKKSLIGSCALSVLYSSLNLDQKATDMAIRVSSVYKYKRFGDEACLVYDDDKKIYSRDSMMLALSSMAYKAFCDIYDSTN